MDKDEKFRCLLRDYDIGADVRFPGLDHWRVEPNGDLCCSYCGGMHPEQFLKHCREVVENPDINIRIEWIAYKGKFYVERPTVKNASEGAIKTRMTHIVQWKDSQNLSVEEADIILEQINKAIKVSHEKFQEYSKKWKIKS